MPKIVSGLVNLGGGENGLLGGSCRHILDLVALSIPHIKSVDKISFLFGSEGFCTYS